MEAEGLVQSGTEAVPKQLQEMATDMTTAEMAEEVAAEMDNRTGSATIHFKRGNVMKIEYRILRTPKDEKLKP